MTVRIGNTEVRNPVLRGLIAVLAVLFAMGVTALVLLVVLPLVGAVLASTALLVAFILVSLVIALPVLILIGVISGPGIRGSGVAKTEQRELPSFGSVAVSGAAKVDVAASQDTEGVTVTTDDNLVEHVSTTVEDGVLHITTTKRLAPQAGPNVRVSGKSIESFMVSGAGKVTLTGVQQERLALKVSGAGHVHVAGQCDAADMVASGAGALDAQELLCEVVSMSLSGAGSATVCASAKLIAKVSGAASITCHGQPEEVDKQVSGAGRVNVVGKE